MSLQGVKVKPWGVAYNVSMPGVVDLPVDPLVRRLQRHLDEGKLIVFAGAGISAPQTPSWKRLAELLLEEAETRDTGQAVLEEIRGYIAERKYIDAFTALEPAIGRSAFRAAIEEALETQRADLTDAAAAIGELVPRLRAVITTNLDTFLERAFGGRWPAITRPAGNLAARQHYIWKIHGTLPEPQTWVLTRDQYDALVYNNPAYRALLATLFSSYHMLFTGFGLADDDFDATVAQLRAWYPDSTIAHYALLPASALPPARKQRLEKLGISCLTYLNADGTHREVPRFLRALANPNAGDTKTQGSAEGKREPATEIDRAGFIGRGFLFERISAFVRENESGYLLLTGDPGIGKTWFARELIRRRNAIYHFNSRPENVRGTDVFLRNVCRQLAMRLGENPAATVAASPADFGNLLGRAAAQLENEPLLVVIDALDEAESAATSGANKLLLPRSIPARVFIVATSRRFDTNNPAPLVESSSIFDIGDDPRHREDARAYIERHIAQQPLKFARLLHDWGGDRESFVAHVLGKSDANFMYLSMMLPAMAEGALSPRELDDPDSLPTGLNEYYWRQWDLMTHEGGAAAAEESRVICMLAVSREPLAVATIVKVLRLSSADVRATLRRWQQFLRKSRGPGGEPVWAIYHASFQDFLRERVGFDEIEDEIIEGALGDFYDATSGSE